MLSLGSKSIGSNYGISLTISPEFDRVTETFDYSVLNMVAELSASVSFLLGLSAIAIYDWLIAFSLWVATRLGWRGGQPKDAEGPVPEGGHGDVPLTQSALLRLQVLHEVERQREQAAAAAAQHDPVIWHVEPSSVSVLSDRGRTESLRPPESAAEERFSTPAAR